ncbi:aminoacyl-tRNA hydrolase [Desulforudis sp. 1088]|uniref:aminoacyl-tRNA hydrolase n=1 Tax=unclassified Candidatus Desulforudis TaxID=2635950 RepID=UPI003CE56C22
MIKAVIGLGNPGETYAATRHNMGFMVVDQLARMLTVGVGTRQCFSLVGEARRGNAALVLAKPQTFMNLSGRAAAALLDRFRLFPSEMLVVCDDMDLPFGRLRLKAWGGSGGHRGMQSVIESLGTDEFPRLRVGIGRGGDVLDHVLSSFSEEERAVLAEVVDAAARAALVAVEEGLEKAMNRFNGWKVGTGL